MQDDAEQRLQRLEQLAHWLDRSIRVPGTSFHVGVDSIIGLIPVAGDAVGAAFSAYIVREAMRIGVPKRTLARMLLNISIELAVGSVPLVGDLFDAAFRANLRNVALARQAHARRRSREQSSAAMRTIRTAETPTRLP